MRRERLRAARAILLGPCLAGLLGAAAAASQQSPYPTGFEFADLTARARWRATLLASGERPPELRQSIERGRALFMREFTPEDGVGPHFNQKSCVACHNQPDPLGRGTPDKAAEVFGRGDKAAFGEHFPLAGTQLKPAQSLPGATPFIMPGDFVFMGRRLPPSLAGLGWIEVIPATQIFSRRHCPDPEPPSAEVCGWAPPKPEAGHGTLRFGIKMTAATLDEFVSSAFRREMGLTTPPPFFAHDEDAVADPEISAEQVIDVANFIAFSDPPGGPVDAAHADGLRTFEAIGCAECHRGAFSVGERPAPEMWSDLLAHDLGPALAETRRDELTPAGHFRTAPLWGMRRHSGPYLHDGRAATLDEAVRAHDGEARSARLAFEALTPGERGRLLAFIQSL